VEEKAVNAWAWAAPTEPNGKMPISLGWRGGFISFDIIGGPYDAFKRGENADFGVCLRAELCPEDLDVLLPIPDFKVPTRAQLEDVEYVIRRALTAAIEGKRVWAGCMGGWGRTGMFLALLAKVADYEDPVGYVRRVYSKKACETKDQCRYVYEFEPTRLRRRLYGSAWRERIRRIVFWWR